MGRRRLEAIDGPKDGFSPFQGLNFAWIKQDDLYPTGGLFASVGQMGIGGFGLSPSSPNPRDNSVNDPCIDLLSRHVSPELGYNDIGIPMETIVKETNLNKKKKRGVGVKIRIGNPSFRRLISGAFAGAVSRTAVAPLETIRTHLMVGSGGNSATEVFENIMRTDGWKGLFRGNLVNVIRVAPSKAIERDVYDNLMHAFLKILREEGPTELYQDLTPSLIGVVSYAATNYFAYDTLKKAYKKAIKTDEIGNIATFLIGSAAGAISSSATFPLEVARKHMQVGAVGGRQVYKSMLHALMGILEKEGVGGLYKGLGPSCLKLVPAAGISFMCYEACKKLLIDKEDDDC